MNYLHEAIYDASMTHMPKLKPGKMRTAGDRKYATPQLNAQNATGIAAFEFAQFLGIAICRGAARSAGTLCTCDKTKICVCRSLPMTIVHRTVGFAAALGASALAFALTLA